MMWDPRPYPKLYAPSYRHIAIQGGLGFMVASQSSEPCLDTLNNRGRLKSGPRRAKLWRSDHSWSVVFGGGGGGLLADER